METAATTPTNPMEASPAKRVRLDVAARTGAGMVAAVLLFLAISLPIWRASLTAPQYPEGLELTAYGDRVEGDLAEIEILNHYVGMKVFDASDVPELKLWVPSMILAIVGAGISAGFGKRWFGRLARLGLWVMPIGVLADVQFRLYQYGHSLSEEAAIRIDPFTPLAVGPSRVLNFTTWAYPGLALLLIWLAAAVLTFGAPLVRLVVGRDTRVEPAPEIREAAAA